MKGLEVIPWAIQCSGAMPKPMIAGFAVLAALIVITIIKARGGDGK